MIVENTRNNQIELAFGEGDICVAGGYIRDNMLNKMGLVTFINQDARKIGVEGIIEGGTPHLIGEFPIIMTFTDSESIDVVIKQLLQAKREMKGEKISDEEESERTKTQIKTVVQATLDAVNHINKQQFLAKPLCSY